MSLPTIGIVGRTVSLVPVGPRQADELYELVMQQGVFGYFRDYGRTFSRQDFENMLWDKTLAQFSVRALSDQRCIGYVQCQSANFHHGTARLNAFLSADVQRRGWPLEGMALFLAYIFRCFDLRKLYGEISEPQSSQFGSALGMSVHVEGRMVDHEWMYGRYVDTLILAIYRDEFLQRPVGRHATRVVDQCMGLARLGVGSASSPTG